MILGPDLFCPILHVNLPLDVIWNSPIDLILRTIFLIVDISFSKCSNLNSLIGIIRTLVTILFSSPDRVREVLQRTLIRNIGEFNTDENYRGNWGEVSFIIPFEDIYDNGEISIGDGEVSDFLKFMEKVRETEISKWAINSSVVEKITCHFMF